MSQSFEERGYQSIRSRHTHKIRELAEHIRADADRIFADLDRARTPSLRGLSDDVRELDRRLHILEALEELKDIYDSGAEAQR